MASSPEKEEMFKRAVARVLSQWTLLNLAVEHGWGGRGPQRRRQELYEWIIQTFLTSRVKSAWLASELSVKLEDLFHVIAEDESDIEVAELLVELYETTHRGDFTLATQVMQTHAGASTAASIEATAPGMSHTGSGEGGEGSFSTRDASDAECDMEEGNEEDDLADLMAGASVHPVGCEEPQGPGKFAAIS
ncbi:pre-rrna-processing protein tsr2 [Cystoisospora suis]|uniref:Pre-rrna-processing protein tsr2 n=1 Tax=Cystoisospora suis TaxID=483139 RepID=A0A2C6KQW4_9APIC|nr:pre-rrna-processing protein tsr2 [Cystoisospora suis]